MDIVFPQVDIVSPLSYIRFPSVDNMYRNEDRLSLQLDIRFPLVGILFAEPDTSFHKRDIQFRLSGIAYRLPGRWYQLGDTSLLQRILFPSEDNEFPLPGIPCQPEDIEYIERGR